MQSLSPKVDHLLSPPYLAALAGLLLNDFVFKSAFPGLITGKLSDFAGLFAFAVFWSVVFPHRTQTIHWAIALAFVLWKSPIADPAIQFWNIVAPFSIGRVLDYWDLLALSVLPLSLAYLRRDWPALRARGACQSAIALVSLFAFAATSQTPVERSQMLARGGKSDAAMRVLDEAIEHGFGRAEAYYHRGLMKLRAGDTAGGEADIAAAAAIDPKYQRMLSPR